MKLFNDFIQEKVITVDLDKSTLTSTISSILDESILFIDNKEVIIDRIINISESCLICNLNESNQQLDLSDEYLIKLQEEVKAKLGEELKKDPELAKLEEGILGKIIGGAAGFIVGPWVGKAIAKALGVEKGILYDLLTSRLFNASAGAIIGDHIGGK